MHHLSGAAAAILAATCVLLLGACTGPTTMIDAATTVAEDRPMGVVLDDAGITIKLNTNLVDEKHRDLFTDVSTNVYSGRVMLTGAVKTAADRSRAAEIAKGIEGVKQVYNEIQVTDQGGVKGTANDLLIETKLKGKLVGAKNVQSINYRWRAVNGVVYFIGQAQDRAELDRVLAIAKDTEDVKRIVTHVWFKT